MPIKGKHRRSRISPLARRLVAVGTGGVALALPLVAAHTASAATAATTVTAEKKSVTTYSVVAGDSLAKIARTHSLSGGWKKLYQDNRKAVGADPSVIHPGLKLTLGGKAATPAATTAKTAAPAPAVQAAAKTYADNLDGWIRESLDVMAAHGIPGTYDGIYRNIMRESSGNPNAINNWDSNAAAGIPSKGLLQVIDPTFQAYHVSGTSMNSYDPVANITAACNYAADKYGSIDNVNGPY
ncbi:LysM peptidoglycan-binding domain-containing protein [Streptomyces sp. NBC_01317]|uniref:LysM peptidoglycan-binding domain-containing protein n=1 Tax=Streptomyces sp. NBC_01317 TaxID=2903822 RepID=UPI002E101285|nr:LysM peptidoglycan-binding domain-containing protein [Streptomyces sp. NBC_01317]